MSSPRSYHLLTDIRGVCYSAFATPNLGITWAVVSLVGGLICLTYKRYNRRSFYSFRSRVFEGHGVGFTPPFPGWTRSIAWADFGKSFCYCLIAVSFIMVVNGTRLVSRYRVTNNATSSCASFCCTTIVAVEARF